MPHAFCDQAFIFCYNDQFHDNLVGSRCLTQVDIDVWLFFWVFMPEKCQEVVVPLDCSDMK